MEKRDAFSLDCQSGTGIYELFLGQRVPKVMLREADRSWFDLTAYKVPCSHCGAVHNSKIWSTENNLAFGNWFGLYCQSCGEIIPVVTNILTFVILLVTAPVWLWFYKPLKKHWLEKQPARYKGVDLEKTYKGFSRKKAVLTGGSYGLIMFIIMLAYELSKGTTLTGTKVFVLFLVWMAGGQFFGWTLYLLYRKRRNDSRLSG